MERRSQPLPFLKISWGGEEKKKKSKMKSKNDSRMGTPLQSSCRSEACSPCVGPKELLRRQIPLSARASPRAGHTLPWHAARCCSALSTHSSAARAPLRSSSALGAPVLSIQVHTSKQTARGAEEIFTKKKKKNWKKYNEWLRGTTVCTEWRCGTLEDAAPLNQTVESGQVSAARLWKRSRTQWWESWWTQRGAGFQRTALVRRRGERAVVCLSSLRAGLHQNPTRISKSTDSESGLTIHINLLSCLKAQLSSHFKDHPRHVYI